MLADKSGESLHNDNNTQTFTVTEECSSGNDSPRNESCAVKNEDNGESSEALLYLSAPLFAPNSSEVSSILEKSLSHDEEFQSDNIAVRQADICRPVPDPNLLKDTTSIDHGQGSQGQTSLFKTAKNGMIKRPYIHRKLHQPKSTHDYTNYQGFYHLHTAETESFDRTSIGTLSIPQITKQLEKLAFAKESVIEYDDSPFELISRFTYFKEFPNDAERITRLYLSAISNVFFFFGGFFYTLVAGYVIHDEKNKANSFQGDIQIDESFNPWSPGKYYVMGLMGPLFFLLNACMDIFRSTRYSPETDDNLGFDSEPRWDIIAASFFGMGATLDLASSLVTGDEQGWQDNTYILSTHLYLVSAVATLIGLKFDASSPGDLLFAIGTMLFLIGNLIDTGLSYFISYGVESDEELYLYKWSFASALLWTVDAVLYLMADFFFSPAPERIITTAKDLGIPCAADCSDNTGVYTTHKFLNEINH